MRLFSTLALLVLLAAPIGAAELCDGDTCVRADDAAEEVRIELDGILAATFSRANQETLVLDGQNAMVEVRSRGNYGGFRMSLVEALHSQMTMAGNDLAIQTYTPGARIGFYAGRSVFAAEITERGLVLPETAEPPTPADGELVFFARDAGAGKTELAVKFHTGAVQVVAAEP